MSPCKRKNTKLITNPSKPGARGENATYLRLQKPRFLFLEGSVRAVVAPVVAAAVLVDELAALADASAARTASSTGCPAAGAPAPVPRPPPLKGPAPRRSPPPPPVTMSSRESPWGEPLLLAQPVLFALLLPALPPLDSCFLLARRQLLYPPLRSAGGRLGPGRWWI
jgi:hypothetical protein